MAEIRAELSRHPVATPLLLSGPMIVARDLVHAELSRRLAAGEPLPAYMKDHPIYYAGPAKTPEGWASGSFGPTTAARMDPYIPGVPGGRRLRSSPSPRATGRPPSPRAASDMAASISPPSAVPRRGSGAT